MKYLLLSILLLNCCLNLLPAQRKRPTTLYDPQKKYKINDLYFDLAILREAFVKAHPGIYWHQSEKEFEARYSQLQKSITAPLTEMEFFTMLTPFVGSIRCDHTNITLSQAFYDHFLNGARFFPFEIRIVESKIYIDKNYTEDSTFLRGTEVTSINEVSTDSLLRVLKPHSWADGYTTSYARVEAFFHSLLLGYFNFPEKYLLEVRYENGKSARMEVMALDNQTCIENYKRLHPTIKNKDRSLYHFRIIDSLNTALIKIEEFEGKTYNKFLERSFKSILDKDIKNLVIDLRQNGGGEDEYAKLLYSYIAVKEYKYYDRLEVTLDDPRDTIFRYGKLPLGKMALKYHYTFNLKKVEPGKYLVTRHGNLTTKPFQPIRNNFRGNVCILIDDKSASATSEFCSVTQYHKRATFIGRETGGGYCGNTSGTSFELKLPHTGIMVNIPLIRYFSAVEGPCGRGVQPDYLLKEEIQSFISGSDPDLFFALDLIKYSK